jgi:hypothetical protein
MQQQQQPPKAVAMPSPGSKLREQVESQLRAQQQGTPQGTPQATGARQVSAPPAGAKSNPGAGGQR